MEVRSTAVRLFAILRSLPGQTNALGARGVVVSCRMVCMAQDSLELYTGTSRLSTAQHYVSIQGYMWVGVRQTPGAQPWSLLFYSLYYRYIAPDLGFALSSKLHCQSNYLGTLTYIPTYLGAS